MEHLPHANGHCWFDVHDRAPCAKGGAGKSQLANRCNEKDVSACVLALRAPGQWDMSVDTASPAESGGVSELVELQRAVRLGSQEFSTA